LKLFLGAGGKIEFETISQEYDLTSFGQVALLLHSMVQIHRLLQVLQHLLPEDEDVPVCLYQTIQRPNGIEICLGPEFAVKILPRMDEARADSANTMYKSISGNIYFNPVGWWDYTRWQDLNVASLSCRQSKGTAC
jgi:hypothetical protein